MAVIGFSYEGYYFQFHSSYWSVTPAVAVVPFFQAGVLFSIVNANFGPFSAVLATFSQTYALFGVLLLAKIMRCRTKIDKYGVRPIPLMFISVRKMFSFLYHNLMVTFYENKNVWFCVMKISMCKFSYDPVTINFCVFPSYHSISMSRVLKIKWHGILVRTLRSGSGPEKNTNTIIQKYKYNVRTLRSGSGPES